MGSHRTFFDEIVQRLDSDMGYDNASGIGCGGVWIDPSEDGVHYAWRLPWPKEIMSYLVSTENSYWHMTNSDLELAALFLQAATFPFVSTSLA